MTAMKNLIAQLTPRTAGAAIASLVTLSAVTAIKPAHAFSVTYDFTVQMTSDAYASQGVMSGATASGSFTYDDTRLTAVSDQNIFTSQGDLTLQFNFLNNVYTEQNDLNYGIKTYRYDYPVVFFDNEIQLIGLDFLVVPAKFQPPKTDLGFRIFKDAFYAGAKDNDDSGTQVGTVTYTAAVPEPSEMGGAIVAFSVLGIWAVRKVKGRR